MILNIAACFWMHKNIKTISSVQSVLIDLSELVLWNMEGKLSVVEWTDWLKINWPGADGFLLWCWVGGVECAVSLASESEVIDEIVLPLDNLIELSWNMWPDHSMDVVSKDWGFLTEWRVDLGVAVPLLIPVELHQVLSVDD